MATDRDHAAGTNRVPPQRPSRPGRRRRRAAVAAEALEGRRLLSAADLDPAFGTGGKVLTAIPGSREDAAQAAFAVGDKLVVAGLSSGAFGVARYKGDGSLDTTFGPASQVGAGRVVTPFPTAGGEAAPAAIVAAAGGKVVVAGRVGDFDAQDIGLARYNADGSLDATFGVGGADGNGRVITNLGGFDEYPTAMAAQADGKLVLVGYRDVSSGYDGFVARYNANGTLDTSFGGGDGWATVNFGGGGRDAPHAVVVLAGGKIVVGGDTNNAGKADFALARLSSTGSADTTFGAGKGWVRTNFRVSFGSASDDALSALLVQGDKLVAVGTSEAIVNDDGDTVRRLALARYNADGSLVRKVETDVSNATIGMRNVPAGGVVQLSTGQLVACAAVDGSSSGTASFRYAADLTPDGTFGGGTGRVVALRKLEATAFLGTTGDKLVTAGSSPFDEGPTQDFRVMRQTGTGSSDAGFGAGGADGSGVVTTDFYDTSGATSETNAYGVAVSSGGKVVVIGQSENGGPNVARYNPDGTLDAGFGTGGFVTLPGHYPIAVGVRSDAKVVVARVSDDFEATLLTRLNADGTVDATFGVGGVDGNGRVTLTGFAVEDLALQSDGRILLAGQVSAGATVARYNADGTVDTTFGTSGGRITGFVPAGANMAIGLDAVGRALVLGDHVVARLTTAGKLDATFGGSGGAGRTVVDIGGSGVIAGDVVALSDGRVAVLVNRFDETGRGLVARLSSAGVQDAAFGGPDGYFEAAIPGRPDAIASALAAAPAGRVLLAAADAVARLNTNGTLDTSFDGGGDGVALTNSALSQDLAVGPDGGIVMVGTAAGRMALAKLRGDVPASVVRVDGTTGNDTIALSQSGSTLTIVRNGSSSTRSLAGVTKIFVYGLDGDDVITVASSVTVGTVLVGGKGNDSMRAAGAARDDLFGGDGTDAADYAFATSAVSVSLDEATNDGVGGADNVHNDVEVLIGGAGADTLTGGGTANVLIGNDGDDTLRGGGGRDVLVGGRGKDKLFGDADEDLLVASRTVYDANPSGLRTLSAEWRSTSRTYADRVARLLAGTPGVRISATNAPADSAADELTGGLGRDWFVVRAEDLLKDKAADETATKF